MKLCINYLRCVKLFDTPQIEKHLKNTIYPFLFFALLLNLGQYNVA